MTFHKLRDEPDISGPPSPWPYPSDRLYFVTLEGRTTAVLARTQDEAYFSWRESRGEDARVDYRVTFEEFGEELVS